MLSSEVMLLQYHSARAPAGRPEVVPAEEKFRFVFPVMADVVEIESVKNYQIAFEKIDLNTSRYPYCIVWTPIPVLS